MKRFLIINIIILTIIGALATPAFAQPGFGMMGMGYGPGMIGGGFSIIFWIVIIGVVYYFFKEYNRNNHQNYNDRRNGDPRFNDQRNFNNGRDDYKKRNEIDYKRSDDGAKKIARERYAKGEITKEELKEILDNLNN